jgi:hypothetical protein
MSVKLGKISTKLGQLQCCIALLNHRYLTFSCWFSSYFFARLLSFNAWPLFSSQETDVYRDRQKRVFDFFIPITIRKLHSIEPIIFVKNCIGEICSSKVSLSEMCTGEVSAVKSCLVTCCLGQNCMYELYVREKRFLELCIALQLHFKADQ